MKIRFVFLILISFLINISASSQVRYSLNDCIAKGLENNFSIRIARNNQTISNNNFTPGNAGLLPTLDLNNKYGGTLNNTTQNLTAGGQNVTNGSFSQTANASLSLGYSIFNGFNAITTYKKLNELNQLGELNTQLTIENYLANVISTYYSYIQQEQLVNNLEYAVTLSKERLRIDEVRYQLRSGSKLEVLQSRVYVNADSSRLSKQIESLRATQIHLNELMAVNDMGSEFSVKDTSIVLNTGLLYEKLLEETHASNTNILIATKNKTISEYDYKIVSSRIYPYLNLSTGYGYNYYTYSTGSTKNQHTDGMNYGLTLGINLFDGFTKRNDLRNSAINIKTKQLQYSEIEQGVTADLVTIYNGYRNNLRLITLEEQNYETANENLSIAMERYKLGSLSGIDLREVQKSLLDAKESLLTVKYQAKLAEISLLQISGRIMDYYK
jgi:outer membrane protein, adhesin transport system